MKYSDIVSVDENFMPMFDLENEEADNKYWSSFIPNDRFREILISVTNSMSNPEQDKSVWLHGTFGIGKSHATSVIKHLLCDGDISNFDIGNNQVKHHLLSFRNNYKILPVVIKGPHNISDSLRFSLQIQSAVKDSLKKNNIKLDIPSAFDDFISFLNRSFIDVDNLVKGTELEDYSKNDILDKLKNNNTKVLILLEDILIRNQIPLPFSKEKISSWLIDVAEELQKEEFGYDYLMIFWDEFTPILDLPGAEQILDDLQDISEKSSKGISLFIVAHKITSKHVSKEKMETIRDRFKQEHFHMDPITTYQIMSKSIIKYDGWDETKNRFSDKLNILIEKIVGNKGLEMKQSLNNIYPIHPYTAYLATFISQEIGSTERSIFNFLKSNDKFGFKFFINTFEIDEKYFLTADWLWDFFINDFKVKNDEKINSVISRYNSSYSDLENEGESYLAIFKVILILNILYKIAEIDDVKLAIPSTENIHNVFSGSIYEEDVETVLNFIDENRIITKNPNDIFELASSNLPPIEVEKERDKLEKKFKLKDLIGSRKDDIQKNLNDKLNRKCELTILDTTINETLLSDYLKSEPKNKNPAYLQLVLFICENSQEFNSIQNRLKLILEEDFTDDKIFIISQAYFEEQDKNKYLDYTANMIIAERFKFNEEAENNKINANAILDALISDIKTNNVVYYLNDKTEVLPFSKLPSKINNSLSKLIFPKGFEKIKGIRETQPLWQDKYAQKLSEKYLTSLTRDELTGKLQGGESNSLYILKDNNGEFIVNNQFKFNDSIDDYHPIILLHEFVKDKFNEAQIDGNFNLGEVLSDLIKPPYGFYPNLIHIPALSFVLREYIGDLYDDKSLPIDQTKMREMIIALFKFWFANKKSNELNIRFGSENEKKLINLLIKLFDLDLSNEKQSVKNIRWEIRDWTKIKQTPLWLFKYSDDVDSQIMQAIDSLFDLIRPDDPNIPEELIQKAYCDLEPVKTDFELILKTNKEFLYRKFILEVCDKISEQDIPKVMEYLIKEMPEEMTSWNKDVAGKKILTWVIQNQPKPPVVEPPVVEPPVVEPPVVEPPVVEPPVVEPPINLQEMDKIRAKIKKSDSEKLKDILIKFLEENEEIQSKFSRYLEE